jgi:DNA-binding SARP family transcriptional activator/outer membrane protein assembly factor BamB
MGAHQGLYIQMLGAFRLTPAEGMPVDLAPNQATILLARLLLEPGRAHGREELAELLWADEDPEVTRSRMRQIIHRVRAVLEQAGGDREALSATTATVQLRSPLIRTDLAELDQALAEARAAGEPAVRMEALRRADALYRGELLPGFYDDFILRERDRRADQRQQLLLSLANTAETEGDLATAVEAAGRAVDLDDHDGHLLLHRLTAAMQRPSSHRPNGRLPECPSDANGSGLNGTASDTVAVPLAHPPGGDPTDHPVPDSPEGARGDTPPTVPRRRWRAWLLAIFLMAGAMTIGVAVMRPPRPATPVVPKGPPRGDLRWIAHYRPEPGDEDSEPVKVLGDLHRGCVVTGYVQTRAHGTDYLTISFGPNGEQLWAKHFNGPGNDLDRARDMAMDRAGNLYVTGESDSGRGNGRTRLSGLDFATIKYSSAGERKWVEPWDSGFRGEDRPCAVVAGRKDCVYVAGSSRTLRGRELVIVKYNAKTGRQVWEHHVGGAPDDEACALAEDVKGNLYLVGQATFSHSRPGDADWLIAKVSAAGKRLWTRRWGEGNGRADRPLQVAVDTRGRLVVAGEDTTLSPLSDIVVVGYSLDGGVRWVERYGGGSGGRDTPSGLVVEGEHTVYVAGESYWADHLEAVCLKITDGRRAWSRPFLGPAGSTSANASGLALGADGLITAVGRFGTEPERRDLFTIHLRTNGEVAWQGFHPADLTLTEHPACVALDSAGEIVVATRTRPRGTQDVTVFKYAARELP